MIYTIEEIRKKVVPVAEKYGIRSLSLFGSYARGEADDESDIDLLIDKGRLTGLLGYNAMLSDLEETLGRHVDMITLGMSDRDFLNRIGKDCLLLYETQR